MNGYKTCENCGGRVYKLGCENCDEMNFIAEQEELTDYYNKERAADEARYKREQDKVKS